MGKTCNRCVILWMKEFEPMECSDGSADSSGENITKAAQLHVTQLHHQLMQLEEKLGVKLFQRATISPLLRKGCF